MYSNNLDVLTPQRHNNPDEDSPKKSKTCKRLTCKNWLLITSFPFLLVWSYILYIGITQGLQFLNHTHWSLEPPAGSPSLVAKDTARSYFTQKGYQYDLSQAVLIVALEPTSKYTVTHPIISNLTRRIINATLDSCDFLPRHRGLCWWRDAFGLFVHEDSIQNPALFEDSDVDARQDFLSLDNTSATMILITNNDGFGAAGNPQQEAAWQHLQLATDEWLKEGWDAHYEVSTTHEQMLLSDSEKGVIGDFEHGDMITLPIAWFILLLSCGPSASIVLVTLPVSLLSVFYCLDQLATGKWLPIYDVNGNPSSRVDFPSFTPAIFINTIIAISLDYGLFMLTRYREEVVRVRSTSSNNDDSNSSGGVMSTCSKRFWMNLEAVAVSSSRAGRVVFISGITLGLTMIGLTFCSVTVVAAIGWGGAAACILAVLIHLTLLPAILIVMGPCCCFKSVDYRCSHAVLSKLWLILSDICCCFGRGKGKDGKFCRKKSDIEVVDFAKSSIHDALIEENIFRSNEDSTMDDLVFGGMGNDFLNSNSNNRNNRNNRKDSTNTRTSMFVSSSSSVSMWVSLGEYCRDHKYKVTLLMLLSLVPFGWLVSQAKFSINLELLTPNDSLALKTLKDISKYPGLNAGWLNPVTILVTNPFDGPSSPYGTISPPCHDDDLDLRLLLNTIHDTNFNPNQFPKNLLTCSTLKSFGLGICTKASIDGHPIQKAAQTFCPGTCSNYCDAAINLKNRTVLIDDLFEQIDTFRHLIHQTIPSISMINIRSITTIPFEINSTVNAKQAHNLLTNYPVRSTPYQAAFERYTNYNQTAVEIQVVLPYVQSCDGSQMLRDIRKLAQDFKPNNNMYGFQVYGDIGVLLDSVDEVFKESPPIVAGVTLLVVFVMAGLSFRSCLIPIRLLGTVVVTLLYVGGCSVLMYQYVLGYDGIYWFVPICTACLVIGLTIDYDVFLISRIYEFRLDGYTTEASILRAMGKQSTTITTAGIIMTIAFSSLLLSKTVVLNQFGFILVSASLIDTFLVRTLLVPSLMFIAVETNWWPGKMPEGFKTRLVDDDVDGSSS